MGCSLHGRHWIVSVCSSSLGEIGSLCNGWYNGINWLANGWMGWKDHMERGWDGVGMEGPTLAGADGAPPLSLEVRWATESGRKQWLTPIATVLQGPGVFVSEQKNYLNRLHTNLN